MVTCRYMDRCEAGISMEELEKSVKSSDVSVLNRPHQEISDEIGDNIHRLNVKSIEEDLLRTSLDADIWILHKVPYMLRQVNEKAYEPRRISIGPYHHGKEHLKAMEVIKRKYFQRMIVETKVEPKKFVVAMIEEVEAIRNCYEGPLDNIPDDKFVNMLVLDGCFILQLFRKGYDCQIEQIYRVEIQCDLLLLENQLPFNVLLKLYSIIKKDMCGQQEIKEELYDLALAYFRGMVLNQVIPARTGDVNRYPGCHLLSLVHDSWLCSCVTKRKNSDASKVPEGFTKCCYPLVARAAAAAVMMFRKAKLMSASAEVEGEEKDNDRGKFISCATDLEMAGIGFKKNGEASLLDIDFDDCAKILRIPRLVVDDHTELILRNMMAYEQFITSPESSDLICKYASFIDNLIDSGKDVQLLRDAEIIDNCLGDDEAVAKMFNRLLDFTLVSDNSDYNEITNKVKKHCRKRRYKWLAALRRDYFNSPWSYISFFAALFLIALTVAQTIFSVLSYVKQ